MADSQKSAFINPQSATGFNSRRTLSLPSKAKVVTLQGCGYAERDMDNRTALEAAAIAYCRRIKAGSNILELGGGSGRLSVSMARAGVNPIMVDRENHLCDQAIRFCDEGVMRAIIKPAENLFSAELPNLSGLVAEKFFHWLPYRNAQKLLRMVGNKMHPGAQAFISIAGFNSPLSKGYASTPTTPLDQRHKPSSYDGNFSHPITLYEPSEAIKLMEDSGFDLKDAKQTDWGMMNITATRNNMRCTPGNGHGYRFG